MKTKHTTRAWMTDGSEIYNDRNTIATINTSSKGISDEEAEANARLIAAAPILLDTAQAVLTTLEAMVYNETIGGMIFVLQDAINRATGND